MLRQLICVPDKQYRCLLSLYLCFSSQNLFFKINSVANVRELLQQLFTSQAEGDSVLFCQVLTVNTQENTCKCQPLNGESIIEEVRLSADGTTEGVVCVPVVGSVVGVVLVNNVMGFVALFSAVESITMRSGSLGGLVKIEALVERLNKIEQALDEIKRIFNTHTHPETGGVTSPTTTPLTQSPGSTQRKQIENDKITHG